MGKFNVSRVLLLCTLFIVAAICGNPVAAQTASAAETTPQGAAPAEGQRGGLEEIVVTAERKSESSQDVPLSVSVVSAAQLSSAGVKTTEDLVKMVPGLQMLNVAAGNVFLRGVGTTNNTAGSESSVALYVDDVYYADSAGVISSLDNVERVEVLKGPQGTLYGRNATGGLIHIITPEPQAQGLVKAEVGYEEYNTVTGSLYATGGLSENLKGSLSASVHDQRRGFGTNLPTGHDANSLNYESYRGKLLWEATARDSITLSGSYRRDTSDYGNYFNLVPGTTSVFGGTYPGNPWDALYTQDVAYERGTWDASLNWRHTFENGMVLKSTSAYVDVYSRLRGYDLDADAPVFGQVLGLPLDSHSFQQEFLLQGSTTWRDHALQYSTGLFYFKYDSRLIIDVSVPPVQTTEIQPAESNTTSYASFGQVDFGLTDRDTLTLGLRYTADEQDVDAGDIVTIPLGTFARTAHGKKDFGEWTWRVALKHAFTDNLMVYGGYSRGYKSGLFNTTVPASGDLVPVNPEILDAYDIGLKGTFLDRSLRVALDGFYYNDKNLQVQNLLNGTATLLTNAADAKIYGAEAEVAAAAPVPVGDLQLSANLGYVHSEYTDYVGCHLAIPQPFPPGGNVFPPGGGDCSGNELAHSPKYTMTFGFDYKVPLTQLGGQLGLSLTYYLSDAFYNDPDNVLRQPAYKTLAAEVSYAFLRDRARVRVYGTNLTDAVIREGCNATDFSSACIAAPPRIVGAAFEYRWE